MVKGEVKTKSNQDQIRREAKRRQQAVRAAKAQADKVKAENYKAGFKFVRDDGMGRLAQEKADKIASRREVEKSELHRNVFSLCNGWRDELESKGVVRIDGNGEYFAEYAARFEFSDWAAKNGYGVQRVQEEDPEDGYMITTGFIVVKVKK